MFSDNSQARRPFMLPKIPYNKKRSTKPKEVPTSRGSVLDLTTSNIAQSQIEMAKSISELVEITKKIASSMEDRAQSADRQAIAIERMASASEANARNLAALTAALAVYLEK